MMLFDPQRLSRRNLILGTAGAATGIGAASSCSDRSVRPTSPTTARASDSPSRLPGASTTALGSSAATWQLSDADNSRLVDTQAGLVLTEDDLLWYRLRPSPKATLGFSYADAFFRRAEKHHRRVVGAHLVWDEGSATVGRRTCSTG